MQRWIWCLAAACGSSHTPAVDALPPAPLRIVELAPQQVDEDAPLAIAIETEGGVAPARIFVTGLPAGARWDEPSHTLSFTPDFTQGGTQTTVAITADDGNERVAGTLVIDVRDTIKPPSPAITTTTAAAGFTRYTVSQTTDDYLDGGMRTFTATVSVPASATSVPVRVGLHGFGGAPATDGSSAEIRIYPHDPDNTYWWGHRSANGTVPPYTARRVLHLVAWVLATFPAADPTRVYLDGGSMGGAGAMVIGTLWSRHFAYVRALWGQAIAKNHRPSRVAQLQTLWGTPAADLDDGAGLGVWTRQDLTRAVRDDHEARDQFLMIKHSKDDPTIHFGAVTIASSLTNETFYAALQSHHVGHFAIWDEGGHGEVDPVLGNNWWSASWDPIADGSLRTDRAFVAFSHASHDRDPGDGTGNGLRPFNAESGYAGTVALVADTGWTGQRAGAINRFLRWEGASVVDTIDRFEVALRVVDGTGNVPPREGDPTTGDRFQGTLPVTAFVTPRRVQAFRTRPGETIRWTLGAQSGSAIADEAGDITVPVALTTERQTLILER